MGGVMDGGCSSIIGRRSSSSAVQKCSLAWTLALTNYPQQQLNGQRSSERRCVAYQLMDDAEHLMTSSESKEQIDLLSDQSRCIFDDAPYDASSCAQPNPFKRSSFIQSRLLMTTSAEDGAGRPETHRSFRMSGSAVLPPSTRGRSG
jgi:hypothetical protein